MFTRAVIFLFGFACIVIICSQQQVATPLRKEKHKRVVTRRLNITEKKVWDKQFSWRDCKKYEEGTLNRTEALYQQLKKVTSVLNKTKYIIGYGTLLGIIRDGAMNANEVDNDIIVDKNFDPVPYKEALFKRGLVIFKSGIYRICDYSPVQRANKPPWASGYYSTYTDIYNQLPFVLVDPEKTYTIIRKKVHIVKRKFREILVNVPDDTLIDEWFRKRYGNWKVPLIKGWKNNVKSLFN